MGIVPGKEEAKEFFRSSLRDDKEGWRERGDQKTKFIALIINYQRLSDCRSGNN